MELQAEMFNRMCLVRSSEMNSEESECKEENDNESGASATFNDQLWKDSGLDSPKSDYGANVFDKSENLAPTDSDM